MASTPTTALVGREHETNEVAGLLKDRHLVTLVGRGGLGKTRLARAVGHRMAGAGFEVRFVDLASIDSADLVPSAMLSAMGLRAMAAQDPIEIMAERIGPARCLLILDNFEHVSDAAPALLELVDRCAHVRILVTSRRALRLSIERAFEVPPLAVPPAEEATARVIDYGAVRLFLERANETGGPDSLATSGLHVVAEVCRRLEGLPLAIELAAARTRHLPIEALLGRLDDSLQLLSGGPVDAPTRHRALREAIAWSYELLDADMAVIFGRLCVFEGGFPLGAAHVIAADGAAGAEPDTLEVLSELIDQSLLSTVEPIGSEPRFRMHDSIREFATTVVDDEAAVRDRHLSYYVEFAERAEPQLEGSEQAHWMVLVDGELDSIRGALRWAQRSARSLSLLRLAGALGHFWRYHGNLREGQMWLSRAAAAAPPGEASRVAKAQIRAGRIDGLLGDRDQALHLLAAARNNARSAGDVTAEAEALATVGMVLFDAGLIDDAVPSVDQALELARTTGCDRIIAQAAMAKAVVTDMRGPNADSRVLLVDAADKARAVGNLRLASVALTNLAATELVEDDSREEAVEHLREAIELLELIDDRGYLAWAYLVLGLTLCRLGRLDEARGAVRDGARKALAFAAQLDVVLAAEVLAYWLGAAGAHRDAILAWSAAGEARERLDMPVQPIDEDWVNDGIARDRAAVPDDADEAFAAGREQSLRDAIEQSLAALEVISAMRRTSSSSGDVSLTPREAEVLGLLVQGLSDTEIAARLYISPKTASVHVAHLKGKLDARSRVEIATIALRLGLVDLEGRRSAEDH